MNWDLFKACCKLGVGWWCEASFSENNGEWIYIVLNNLATANCSLDNCCAAPTKGIVNKIAGVGEALDEVIRELGFETCTV